ncbi:MAG: GumC family protein [Flavobacteriales bacterium]
MENSMYNQNEESSINIMDLIIPYLRNWKAYVVCVTLCLLGAFFYLKNITPIYQASTSLMLKNENNKGSIGSLGDFENLGIYGGASSEVENELEILKSRHLVQATITRLKTNIEFWEIKGFKKTPIYQNTPVQIKDLNESVLNIKKRISFDLEFISETEGKITFVNKDKSEMYAWGSSLVYDSLHVILLPKIDQIKANIGRKVRVVITPMELAVDILKGKISFNTSSKQNDVIKLKLKDASKERAKDILNTLVYLYNENAITDKKEVNLKTEEFIENRLTIIKNELSKIEKTAENYKTTHQLIDIQSQSNLFSQNMARSRDELMKTETQIRLAEYLVEQVDGKPNEFSLVPVDIVLDNQGLNSLSNSYNDLVIDHDRIEQTTHKLNPILKNLEAQLFELKRNIQQSLRNYIQTLKITKTELIAQERIMNREIATIPMQERQYRNIARQQELKEALYLFLLQKREETSLSLAATSSNSKIIDKAYSSRKPVAPVTRIILLIGLLIGLILPTIVIYIRELIDTKIHNKKEFETLMGEIPILGDIPTSKEKNSRIVTTSDRSSTAEAFRILLTNLNFLISKKSEGAKVICVTSTIAGEGKTYVSTNLSTVLSFSKKKTLLIGADVRNPKMADYFTDSQQHLGLTNYLSDESMTMGEVIVPQSDNANLDVIFSGIIPPNPVELLSSERFENLMSDLGEKYDYIVLDTAPVSLVTDTLLISKFADMFVYVSRAEYLDKRMLEVPKNLYKQNRLPNMAMVLNDIDVKKGYGYGFGYGYGEHTKKKWYSIFSS